MMTTLKKVFILGMTTTIITFCTTPGMQVKKHWAVYQQAMSYGDLHTAIVELNSIYVYDTTKLAVLDTLSRLYFMSGNSLGAYKTIKKLKEINIDQQAMLAESALKIGLDQEAKTSFSELVERDSTGTNIRAKYTLATLHYADKEYKAAIDLLDKVAQDENSVKETISVNIGDGLQQKVSLYAASWNFAGFVMLETKEYETAEKYLKEALRAQPNFQLAINNMELLMQLNEEKME